MFGQIFMLIISALVAALMIGIGIYQIKCKKPAGFYSGVEPPKPEELTDVRAWNCRHGGMWVLYGIVIIVTTLVSLFTSEIVGVLLFIGGIMLPIPFMVWWHHRLERVYLKKG